MMSEQKVTNYAVPVIFEPPCICDILSVTFCGTDVSVVFSLFMVLIFSCCTNVQLLRFYMVVME